MASTEDPGRHLQCGPGTTDMGHGEDQAETFQHQTARKNLRNLAGGL